MHIFYRKITLPHQITGGPHAVAWGLLADALDAQGVDIDTLPLAYTTNGKPYFDTPNAPHFSISHTIDFVVCAISASPIGIDTEPCTRTVSPAVCHRFLNDCSPQSALQKWTERESFGKLTGEGVAKQTIAFDAQVLCHTTFVTEGHLITVCHHRADEPTPPLPL